MSVPVIVTGEPSQGQRKRMEEIGETLGELLNAKTAQAQETYPGETYSFLLRDGRMVYIEAHSCKADGGWLTVKFKDQKDEQ
jgi:hypothetical protein